MNYTTETPTETGYYWLSKDNGPWKPAYVRIAFERKYIHEFGYEIDKHIQWYLDLGCKLRWIQLEKPNIE
jgi:hypothetical protein